MLPNSNMIFTKRVLQQTALNKATVRFLSSSPRQFQESVPLNSRANDTARKHREFMLKKPLNPHMTNTNSTIANSFPSVGADKPPADMITSVKSDFVPTDSVPENTERMVGGTQGARPKNGANAELDVGEIEGSKVKIAPLKRQGESEDTLRARLTYQSRKRGTLESDLLLSTFADAHLSTMTYAQMQSYDTFLDENDWDIYYWATQVPPATSQETAEGGKFGLATHAAAGSSPTEMSHSSDRQNASGADRVELARAAESSRSAQKASAKASSPSSGEWAYTIGTFKPAYRPVPIRWKNSEILAMLRKHVIDRSAGGVHEGEEAQGDAEGLARSVKENRGGGLGMMPPLKDFRSADSSA